MPELGQTVSELTAITLASQVILIEDLVEPSALNVSHAPLFTTELYRNCTHPLS